MKNFLFLMCCFFVVYNLYASEWSVEARIAYFRPTSKKVQDVYGKGWPDYQVEIGRTIDCHWSLWANISGFSKKGKSMGFGDETKLRFIPLSLGAKFTWWWTERLGVYAGAGGCYSHLKIHVESPFGQSHISKRAFGAVAKLGAYYFFNDSVFLDLFADYLYQPFRLSRSHLGIGRHDVHLSGWKVGTGLGLQF